MTPHIEAKKDDIAPIVLMPGDPMRAKMIADNFLEDAKLVNQIRGMYAYTGFYKGKRLTVMASGMGMPSIGIYSYELYNVYDVKAIIRIGTAGAYIKDINLYDILIADASYSESSYAYTQNKEEKNILPSTSITNIIEEAANDMNIPYKKGLIHSSDVFYRQSNEYVEDIVSKGCLAVEMESFALFHNANVLGREAACILTVSDNLITKEETTPEERQNSLKLMITLALEAAIRMNV